VTEDTTGSEQPGFELVPPYPLATLVEAVLSEFATTEDERSRVEELLSRKLPPLLNGDVLALALGVTPKLIYAMAHVPDRYYRTFELPKKSGGTRKIATPKVFLKVVQRWILYNILYKRELPEYVTGFVEQRGILVNARRHVGKRYLVRFDIQNFFPSIRLNRVRGVYADFGFPPDVAHLLARLSCLRGVLPQGAPTSPYVANLAFLPCDVQIATEAGVKQIAYSRYADDLTFSSDAPIRPAFLRAVEKIIREAGFRFNAEKSFRAGPGQRLFTVGMVVNEKAQPLRTLRRKLRARFHQASLHPISFSETANELLGWAAYVNMYDPPLGAEYLNIARRVLFLTPRSSQPRRLVRPKSTEK